VAAVSLTTIAVGGGGAELHTQIWTTVLDEICGTAAEEFEPMSEEGDLDQAIAQVAQVAEEISQHATVAEVTGRAMYDQLSNLGNVLDDEERAALVAGIEEEIEKEPEARSQKPEEVLSPSQPTPKPEVQERESEPVAGMIRAREVVELEMGRGSQWETVEESIRDLVVESVVLDARPPMVWAKEACVAVDGEGGMHVWMLYKDGVSWFALREWANEHRAILALTRRDLAIEREGAVRVHVVMPLGSGGEEAKPLLRTEAPGVCVYRLRWIQWQGRRGVVVVPIA